MDAWRVFDRCAFEQVNSDAHERKVEVRNMRDEETRRRNKEKKRCIRIGKKKRKKKKKER